MKHLHRVNKSIFIFASFAFIFFANAVFANGQSFTLRQGQSQTLTYTSSFGSAGAATATFRLSGNVIIVNYKNTSTDVSYLNGIAFNAAPHILPESLATATATSGWRADVGPGGGLGSFDLVAYGVGRTRLAPGASGTATFILDEALPEITTERSIVHLTSLPDESSEKPIGVVLPPSTPPTTPTNPTPCTDPSTCSGGPITD